VLSSKRSPPRGWHNTTPRQRQIAANAVTQWFVTAISAVCGLLVVPFLIHHLGKEGYGLVSLALAVAGLCALADLGVSGALSRHLAESLAQNDHDKFTQYVSTAVTVNAFAGIVASGTLFLSANFAAKLVGLSSTAFHAGVTLIRTFCTIYVLVTFLTFVPRAILASHNRFDLSSTIDGVRRLMQNVGLLAALGFTHLGLSGWATVCGVVEILAALLLWAVVFRVQPYLKVGWRSFRWARLQSLFGLGSQLTILQLSKNLSESADPFILSACLGPASVALYRPATQIFSGISPVVLTLSNQLHPVATHIHVTGDRAALTSLLLQSTKFTMLMGAVACGSIVALAEPLCRFWLAGALGEQYRVCASVLTIQAITQFTAFAGGAQGAVLLGMNKTEFLARGRFVLAVFNIIISFVLVRYTALGVIGVVLPTMVIELLWRPLLAQYVCRASGISSVQYVRRSCVTPILMAAIVAAGGLGIQRLVPIAGIAGLIWLTVGLAVTGTALTWFAGLTPCDRISLRAVAQWILVGRWSGAR